MENVLERSEDGRGLAQLVVAVQAQVMNVSRKGKLLIQCDTNINKGICGRLAEMGGLVQL